jgi:alkylhydroperoxidase/carboxymuconolactone decarboxylase family protein YurZ
MTMTAVQTCRERWQEVRWHIKGAYEAGAPEVELAEALSFTMFPGSVPNFVEACAVWQQMIRAGEVAAS